MVKTLPLSSLSTGQTDTDVRMRSAGVSGLVVPVFTALLDADVIGKCNVVPTALEYIQPWELR